MSQGKALYQFEENDPVAKAVENAIDNKDPPVVEAGPASNAVTILNHTKFNDEKSLLPDNVIIKEVKEYTMENQNDLKTMNDKGGLDIKKEPSGPGKAMLMSKF